MIKLPNTGKFVVSVSLRQEISSFSKRIAPNWSWNCRKIRSFVVFDALSVEFPWVFVIRSNTIINERTSEALHFLRERSSVLLQKHFRMTPNEAKKFNIVVFIQLFIYSTSVYFLNCFGVRITANVAQSLNSYFCWLSKKYLQTSSGKWLKIDCKSRKCQTFCRFDIVSEFLFQIGKFR